MQSGLSDKSLMIQACLRRQYRGGYSMAEQIYHYSLQELFTQGFFRIPDYQRGYSWEQTHRADLLSDIEKLRPGRKHFTGTIVVHPKDRIKVGISQHKLYDIVDGQQRLTTIIILLQCIYERLKILANGQNDENVEDIRTGYVKTKGIPKIMIAEPNSAFFSHILDGKQELFECCDNRTQHNLKDAYYQFSNFFDKRSLEMGPSFGDWLMDFFDRLTTRLVVNFYEIEDELSVGIVFEVVNDRGKGLSQLDKVKNFLIYSILECFPDEAHTQAEALVHKVNDTWASVFQSLELANRWRTENEEQFLRAHWLICYNPNPRIYDIHKEVKTRFGALSNAGLDSFVAEVDYYLDSLKEYAGHYQAVYKPNGAGHLSIRVRDSLHGFNRMGNVATPLPLLMALLHRFFKQETKLFETVSILEKFVFRVAILAQKRSNTGVNWIIRLASQVHGMNTISEKALMNELTYMAFGAYVGDAYLSQLLSDPDFDYYGWRGIRYFLYEYEKYVVTKHIDGAMMHSWEYMQQKVRSKQPTIEHILPQTIKGIEYWERRFKTEKAHARWCHSLGNLVLTDSNEAMQNNSFGRKKGGPGKKHTYATSGWKQEQDLVAYQEWGMKEIQLREKALIDFAVERWGGHVTGKLEGEVPPDEIEMEEENGAAEAKNECFC